MITRKRSIFAMAAAVVLAATVYVWAQNNALGIGGQPASMFASSISGCPTVTSGYFLCIVTPSGSQPFLALSVAGYNAGAPFQVASQGPAGLTGAQGPAGPAGPAGTAATVKVGTVTTLAAGASATVANSGTTSAAVLNFGIPQGLGGANGAAATVKIGTVTTLAAGANATLNNSGTTGAAVLNFGLPQGPAGATGPAGPIGPQGPAQSFGTAVCPAYTISGTSASGSITIGPGCTETTP